MMPEADHSMDWNHGSILLGKPFEVHWSVFGQLTVRASQADYAPLSKDSSNPFAQTRSYKLS